LSLVTDGNAFRQGHETRPLVGQPLLRLRGAEFPCGRQENERRAIPPQETIHCLAEIVGLDLDGQVDRETVSGVWRVNADARRSGKVGRRVGLLEQTEDLGERRVEGRTIQLINHDVGSLQDKGLASTFAPADGDNVLRIVHDHFVLTAAAALNHAGM